MSKTSYRQDRKASAQVYFDDKGQIVSVIIPDPSPSAPPTGIMTPKGCHCLDVELSGDLTAIDPLMLHTNYRVDIKGRSPQLERCQAAPQQTGKKSKKKG